MNFQKLSVNGNHTYYLSLLIIGLFSICFLLSFTARNTLTIPSFSLFSLKSSSSSSSQCSPSNSTASYRDKLEAVLAKTSTANKTVIIAVINKAYAEQDVETDTTMLDVFLSSFWLGEETRVLVDHLLLVAVDQTAYDRCRFLQLNCYKLDTNGVDFAGEKVYMSSDFINMMWSRTSFLLEVLKRGYNFIFTDSDVMWLRSPFEKLSTDQTEDLQISTDSFNGDSWSTNNNINTGFYFVRSNNKTISLYQKWYERKDNSKGMKEQDVLEQLLHSGNIITQLGLKIRYLDTLYFSGFCQNSRDFKQVITVHANCCRTIIAKIVDLSRVLRDWKRFKRSTNAAEIFQWSDHRACADSWRH